MPDAVILEDSASVSRLHLDIARRIMRLLRDDGAEPGYRLVESALCERLNVSRTPVRGALKYLASQDVLKWAGVRQLVLARPIGDLEEEPSALREAQAANSLLMALAKARLDGTLPEECSQQDICRMFGVFQPVAARVMRHLADLGLVERKLANGWSFAPSADTQRALIESYAVRRLIEPALVLQDTFVLDRDWLARIKAEHHAFLERPWHGDMAVEFHQLNAEFHENLAWLSGNRYFYLIVQRHTQLRAFICYRREYTAGQMRESIEEHLSIIEALERGSQQLVAHKILDHLYRSTDRF